MRIIYVVMQCVRLNPTSGFKWIDPKEFDVNKY